MARKRLTYKHTQITIDVSLELYDQIMEMCEDCGCCITDYIVMVLCWTVFANMEFPDLWRLDCVNPDEGYRTGWSWRHYRNKHLAADKKKP